MSLTLIRCQKCGYPLAYCNCSGGGAANPCVGCEHHGGRLDRFPCLGCLSGVRWPEEQRPISRGHEVGEAIKALDTLEIEHETLTVAFNRALEVLDANPALRRYLWGGK